GQVRCPPMCGPAVGFRYAMRYRALSTDGISHMARRTDAQEERQMALFTRLRAFVSDDSGQDLLEYALLIGLIALVTVLAVTNAGTEVNRIFTSIAASLTAVP